MIITIVIINHYEVIKDMTTNITNDDKMPVHFNNVFYSQGDHIYSGPSSGSSYLGHCKITD